MEAPILTLADMAESKIREIIAEREEDCAIRVRVRQNGPMAFNYSMQFVGLDERAEDDTLIDDQGIPLFIDAASIPMLRGATLKYIKDDTGSGFMFDNPNKTELMNNPIAVKVHEVIQEQINPGIASHGGAVTLVDIKGDQAYIRFSGGCQGCGMADVTLKDGVEKAILDAAPEIRGVVDATNHADGENPYFAGDGNDGGQA